MKDKSVALDYTEKIKDRIIGLGADLVGIADVEPLKDLKVDPPDLLDPFTKAVFTGDVGKSTQIKAALII